MYSMKATIYTTSTCPFCQQEKTYLQSKGIAFEEKNVELNKAFLDEMLQVGNNFAGVPVTKIDKNDGQSVVLKGFTQAEFDSVLSASQPVVQSQPASPTGGQTPDPVTPPAPPVVPEIPVVPTPEPVVVPTPDPVPTPAPVVPEIPVTPVVPEMPATPPVTEPVAPSAQVPADPLNSILKDLQTRMQTDASANTPQAPTVPAPEPASPGFPTPPSPTTPPVSEPVIPPVTPPTPPAPAAPGEMPAIPDFPAK